MAGKKPALFPVCPKVQSPHHRVLDSLRTPSTDPLVFLRFCKASWLALKGKALMFISRIYKDEGLKFQSLSLAKMKEVVLFKSQGYYSSFLCGLLR